MASLSRQNSEQNQSDNQVLGDKDSEKQTKDTKPKMSAFLKN
jgi:hypothetical protein